MLIVSSAILSIANIIRNFINRLGVRNNCIFGGLLKADQKILFISTLVMIAPFPYIVMDNIYLMGNKYLNK